MVSELDKNNAVMDYRVTNLQQKKDDTSNALSAPIDAQQTQTASGTNNALKSNALGEWQNGNCEHCKQHFLKKTTWQRFCSIDCREESYFLKTGKTWKGKKKAAG